MEPWAALEDDQLDVVMDGADELIFLSHTLPFPYSANPLHTPSHWRAPRGRKRWRCGGVLKGVQYRK
jgi:hypothetical protein